MTSYRIEITNDAYSDLEGIVRYVSRVLSGPDTALRLYDRLIDTIFSLEQFPARNAPVPFEPERSAGLRRINAGKYAIFYTNISLKS